MHVTEEEISESIKRLGLTADGRNLYLRLQRVLMSLAPRSDAGALQLHEGRRTLAQDLKSLMDEGLASAELTSGERSTDPDRPIVVLPRGSVAVAGDRSRRRVSEYVNKA